MSTRIDDLPGPPQMSPDEIVQSNTQHNSNSNSTNLHDDTKYEERNNETNIKANIKKKVHFSDEIEYLENKNEYSITDWLKSEINEENLMFVILIYLAGLPSLDNQILRIPYVEQYLGNEFILGIIKALILLIIFVISKRYILPKLKV